MICFSTNISAWTHCLTPTIREPTKESKMFVLSAVIRAAGSQLQFRVSLRRERSCSTVVDIRETWRRHMFGNAAIWLNEIEATEKG